MSILIAGSNPAEVILGVDEETKEVKYSVDGEEWNSTTGTGGTGGASADDVLNAIGNYEAQLAAI